MSLEIKNASQEEYFKLLNKIFSNKEEERNLALDRYHKVDEMMVDSNHFLLHGKNAIGYLSLASEITNALIILSKDIKSIAFPKLGENAVASSGNNDEMLKKISEIVKNEQKANLANDDDAE